MLCILVIEQQTISVACFNVVFAQWHAKTYLTDIVIEGLPEALVCIKNDSSDNAEIFVKCSRKIIEIVEQKLSLKADENMNNWKLSVQLCVMLLFAVCFVKTTAENFTFVHVPLGCWPYYVI